ncbi:MAG: ATP-binding protein [bacterium]
MVEVCVADTGKGFSNKDQERVFEKYVQLSDKVKGKISGTGLGLTICQEIIKHHGGKIWSMSQPGKGSKFFFTLPTNR